MQEPRPRGSSLVKRPGFEIDVADVRTRFPDSVIRARATVQYRRRDRDVPLTVHWRDREAPHDFADAVAAYVRPDDIVPVGRYFDKRRRQGTGEMVDSFIGANILERLGTGNWPVFTLLSTVDADAAAPAFTREQLDAAPWPLPPESSGSASSDIFASTSESELEQRPEGTSDAVAPLGPVPKMGRDLLVNTPPANPDWNMAPGTRVPPWWVPESDGGIDSAFANVRKFYNFSPRLHGRRIVVLPALAHASANPQRAERPLLMLNLSSFHMTCHIFLDGRMFTVGFAYHDPYYEEGKPALLGSFVYAAYGTDT